MHPAKTLLFLSMAFAASTAFAAPQAYQVVDLGPAHEPHAVRDGIVVGRGLADFPAPDRAEAWQHGTWSPLKDRGKGSSAEAVNAAGDVAGEDAKHPVRWQHGHRTPLAGVNAGTAEGIADDGTIVGTRGLGSTPACYAWKDGVATDLGTLGGHGCRAHAIDPTGTYIGGESYVPPGTGASHAFIRDAAGMHDLGLLPHGAYSWVRAVNRHGHASVWADTDNSGDWAAAFWNGRKLVEVPGVRLITGESFSGGINAKDEMLVVGDDGAGHSLFVYGNADQVRSTVGGARALSST